LSIFRTSSRQQGKTQEQVVTLLACLDIYGDAYTQLCLEIATAAEAGRIHCDTARHLVSLLTEAPRRSAILMRDAAR